MENIEIKLHRVIGNMTYIPNVRDGDDVFPLFAKKNNAKLENQSLDTKADNSLVYQSNIKDSYSSPTNIRRLFITNKGVRVDLYRCMRTNQNTNKQTLSKFRVYNEKDLNEKLGALLEEVMYSSTPNNYREQEYNTQKVFDKNAKAPRKVKVNGWALNVVSGAYTLNNIEEIYIDWTLFFTTDNKVAPIITNIFGKNNLELALLYKQKAEQQITNGGITVDQRMKQLLLMTIGDGSSNAQNNLRKRFPRLKSIGFIQNLNTLVNTNEPNALYSQLNNDTNMLQSKNAGRDTWFRLNEGLIGQYGGDCLISEFKIDPLKQYEFNIKSETYKFDDDVLKGFAKSLAEKGRQIDREKKYGPKTTEDAATSTATSDVEKQILDIIKSNNNHEGIAKMIVQSAAFGLNKDLKRTVLDGFSKPNRDKMTKWFLLSKNKNKK